MPLIFCNIGWMERYLGQQPGDQIVGGGSYVKEEGYGHEVCNFKGENGILYGYVQPPGEEINIERIGASEVDDSVSGVTVVWTATRPTGGTAVVGWYNNATVFRHYKKFDKAPVTHRKNGLDGYWIKVAEKNAALLPIDERTCEIPRQVKGGMGQANIWYADKPQSSAIVKRVLQFLGGKRFGSSPKKGRKAKQDQERKAQIEKAAIRACCDHFESLGYEVESVEKDNRGWDLEAQSGKSILRIEVKGLSGKAFAIELTPNEFLAFAENSDAYRLAVVLDALKSPSLLICRYSREQSRWIVEGNDAKSIEVIKKESASIRCS